MWFSRPWDLDIIKKLLVHSTLGIYCTDKKEKKIFLICKEIQKGPGAKSYMTNGLPIYD